MALRAAGTALAAAALLGGQLAVPAAAESLPARTQTLAPTSEVSPGFRDVPQTSQFYREISWLAGQGISTGYPDGTFRPVAPVARDAMAAFMNRFAGEQCSVQDALGYQAPGAASFTDVPADNQFHKEISWMKDSGVSTGYPDASFHPYENVSREAMAAFIHRLDTYNKDNGGCNSF